MDSFYVNLTTLADTYPCTLSQLESLGLNCCFLKLIIHNRPHTFSHSEVNVPEEKFNVPEKQFIISMGSFRSKFSIKMFGHRHMSNISE